MKRSQGRKAAARQRAPPRVRLTTTRLRSLSVPTRSRQFRAMPGAAFRGRPQGLADDR